MFHVKPFKIFCLVPGWSNGFDIADEELQIHRR
jgi:hypothetical protein